MQICYLSKCKNEEYVRNSNTLEAKICLITYVTTDRELYNIELMVKLHKLFFNCEISGWGFMLISIKDHPAIS